MEVAEWKRPWTVADDEDGMVLVDVVEKDFV